MILGIESSCDESAMALYHPEKGIVGEWVHSQMQQHSQYGGVVPDLAVRQHLEHFFPILELLRESPHPTNEISEIAVTCGPGLVGCLGVGLSIAKTLGELWSLPVYGVNHLRGHAFSPFLGLEAEERQWREILPHLGLLVSGGNTLLFEINLNRDIHIIGRTMDDAAGEALDKGAKLLGIAYPGGAELEKFAGEGNAKAFAFPRAFKNNEASDFSFSGLKTSLLYQLQKMDAGEIEDRYSDLCASYQEAAVDQLAKKCSFFIGKKNYKTFGLSGGVANNQSLRNRLHEVCTAENLKFYAADKKYTGDNAAMIAFAAYLDPDGLWPNEDGELNFNPSLKLDSLPNREGRK